MGLYNNKTDWLFCGQKIVMGSHGHDKSDSEVLTDSFTQTILGHCENGADEWAFTVKGSIEYFGNDFYATDCIYHAQCSTNFKTGRDIPEQIRTGPAAKQKRLDQPNNGDQ